MARFSALRGRDLGDLAWTGHSPVKKHFDTDRGLLGGRVGQGGTQLNDESIVKSPNWRSMVPIRPLTATTGKSIYLLGTDMLVRTADFGLPSPPSA